MSLTGREGNNMSLAALASIASFISLSTIFGCSMWNYYRAIDWPYAEFAAVRILAISIVVGSFAYWFGPRRSRAGAFLFGALIGPIAGATYVYAVTA